MNSAKAELVSICDVFADGDWIETKDQSENGIRLIQTGNVGFGKFKLRDSKARYISEETFKRLRCTEIKQGDILISRLPDPVGRACVIPELNVKSITAVDCTIIRTNKKIINTEYLNYFCQSYKYFEQVKKNITGATRQRISRNLLGKIEVPVPPLPIQQKIVDKLDAIFSEIDKATASVEANAKNAEVLFESYLKQVFGREGECWEMVKLGDVLKTSAGGTPLKSIKKYYEGGDIPWLMSGEVCLKDINTSLRKITKLGLDNSSAKLFPTNTTLIAMYGATAGQVGILRFPATTNQAVCGIMPNKNYLPEFLYYYLSFYKKTLLLEVSGVAQPNLSQIKIKNISIPKISVAIQQKILVKLDEISTQVNKLNQLWKNKINELTFLKQSILKQAFNGELVKAA
jgi:type I restriction enzyme S subunit